MATWFWIALILAICEFAIAQRWPTAGHQAGRRPQQQPNRRMKYRLYYFGIRQRAEPIRLLFHQARVPFESMDVKQSDWPNMKPTTPFGHLPVLDINGRMLAESRAIARYLANRMGLSPRDPVQRAMADMYVDAFTDCNEEVWKKLYPLGKKPKAEQLKAFNEVRNKSLDACLRKFSKYLQRNGGRYLVGNRMTWADIWVAELLDQMDGKYGPALFNTFPAMKRLRDTVYNSPNIKSYVATRKYQ